MERKAPHALSAIEWAAFAALRDRDPVYDNPMFDPAICRVLDRVRTDVQVICITCGDEPVGFWPLHVRPGRWARPLGGPFSDWQGPILAKGLDLSLAQILRGAGLKGATLPALAPRFAPGDGPFEDMYAIADYRNGWDAYIDSQSAAYPKHFKKMRRLKRKLAREIAGAHYTLDDTAPEVLDWLIARKRTQYAATGRHDVLGPAWARQFLTDLRSTKGPRFKVRLSTLRFKGQIAAAELNMWSDEIIHGWITGFDPQFSAYSPGYLLMEWVMAQSANLGIGRSDMGPGEAVYKTYYTSTVCPVASLIVRSSNTLRPWAAGWRFGEFVSPLPMRNLLQRARRRGDQILATELSRTRQLAGLAKALARTDL